MYIPKFSVDVEYRLRQANLLHLRDGTHLIPSKELKHNILETIICLESISNKCRI